MEGERKTAPVMIDGSRSSEGAFDLCLAIYRHCGYFNFLKVIYVFDPKKTYLADKYKEAHIKQHYEHRLVSQLPPGKYSVDLVEKRTTSKKDAFEEAEAYGCELVFMGFHGRKGESGKEVSLMGSIISTTSVFTHFPYMVFKEAPKGDNLTFGVCFDGSAKAHQALAFAAGLLAEKDRLW